MSRIGARSPRALGLSTLSPALFAAIRLSLLSFADLPTLSVVTHSHPKPEPEWLTEHKAAVAAAAGRADASAGGKAKKPARATVNEECPSCKAPFMEFYAMQLRSADEGQTVFYECVNVKCGHKFSVNT